MEMKTKTLKKGIYIIVDPSQNLKQNIEKLNCILHLPICAVQIWDNFPAGTDPLTLIDSIVSLCHNYEKLVIINNRWEYLLQTAIDGVHFDTIPHNITEITHSINRPFVKGLTCGNDIKTVEWAYNNHFDYISFCSVFPSVTANSCELIDLQVVKESISKYPIPVFLAGGITPHNLAQLAGIDYHGIAVVSGIMSAHDPLTAAQEYLQQLKL
jgi:thiamine-phosphate pyrophosphorylase